MTDADLDALFDNRPPDKKAKHRNFLTYVAGSENDRVERRVRVNCKYDPWDSRIKYPPEMVNFKKTTMVKYWYERLWQ
eukprot:8610687-Karenia_brevis.AAC.1